MVEKIFTLEQREQTPAAYAQVGFEHFMAYSGRRKPDFYLSFKNNAFDSAAWCAFVENFNAAGMAIAESHVEQPDTSKEVRMLFIDGVEIRETYQNDEMGVLASVTYEAPITPNL